MNDLRDGLNTPEDWEKGSGDLIRFHTTWKSGLKFALNLLKIPENWVEGLTGNGKILYEGVYQRYMKVEQNEHRKSIIGKLLIAAILVYNYDSGFAEIGNYLMAVIKEIMPALYLPPYHLDPSCWSTGETRQIPILTLTLDEIVAFSEAMLVTKGILPPQKYLLQFVHDPDLPDEVQTSKLYVINTNHPVWMEIGWRYQIIKALKDDKEAVFGD